MGEAPDISVLKRLRRKSLRIGVWFRALDRAERGLLDLTIRCVKEVRSEKLAMALVHVLSKLFPMVRSRFLNTVEGLGRPLAERLSDAACRWGNIDALKWRFDISFMRWLGLTELSNRGWRMIG